MYKNMILNSSILDKIGEPTITIFANYDDALSDEGIRRIMESSEPSATFHEVVSEIYEDEISNKELEVLEDVIRSNQLDLSDSERELLMSEISELLEFDLPFDHYKKQKVTVDLFVDTGDGNYDFWPNASHVPHYNGTMEPMHESASILWLAKQQGYTEQQLYAALESAKGPDPKTFLGSVRQEIENASCSMLALTFLVEMTVSELATLNELVRFEEYDSVVIDKNCSIGLYDWSYGGGGVLDIQPDKDVVLPLKYIRYPVLPDGKEVGHSIANCYGLCSSAWTHSIKQYLA